jgi:hypothetical protein
MNTATLPQNPEISLLPSRQTVQARLAVLRSHPHNRAALWHLEALNIDPYPDLLPVLELAQWAIENRPDECTYQHPTEAALTLADWQLMPQAAMRRVEESMRPDDLADMEPAEAAVSLMLALTAPA